MKISRLALAALASFALTGAALKELAPASSPAPRRPAGQAPVSDPAEPPLKAEVAFGPGQPQPVTAAGTTLKFNATGSWQGTAGLTFKSAPPMRFKLTLARMPNYDLQSLTLASGRVSLAVGYVSASPTTRYFDARGEALKGPDGAAYTVKARRWDGELDVEVRRAPGAAMGKALTVNWQGNINYGRGLRGRW